VGAPKEEKKEAQKGRKSRSIRPAPTRKQKITVTDHAFIHQEPFPISKGRIENLSDFVNAHACRNGDILWSWLE
jgi:hypothetical protein